MAEDAEEHSPLKPSSDKQRLSIGEALDNVSVGRFHAFLTVRMVFAWMVLSTSQDVTAYALAGLRYELGATSSSLAKFASAVSLGGILGSLAGSGLIDSMGRRLTALVMAPVACALHMFMALSSSMPWLICVRFVQAAVMSSLFMALPAWYSEFLPTRCRGQLMAVYSIGYPLGRGLLIEVAGATDDSWRFLMVMGGAGFALLAVLIMTAPESPRYLLSSGRIAETRQVLARMHGAIGGKWDRETKLCMGTASVEPASWSNRDRLNRICSEHSCPLAFSMTIFAILSSTTVLLDTWGPTLFARLVAPDSKQLPHSLLQLFNLGDLCGVIANIFIADKLGRRGSFFLGFLLQGFLYALMAGFTYIKGPNLIASIKVTGSLAWFCRCYGWEAAQFWTLEAFPTDVRAMAFGIAMTSMRAFSVATLEISGRYTDSLAAEAAIAMFAAMLCLGGIVVLLTMPFETANRPLM